MVLSIFVIIFVFGAICLSDYFSQPRMYCFLNFLSVRNPQFTFNLFFILGEDLSDYDTELTLENMLSYTPLGVKTQLVKGIFRNILYQIISLGRRSRTKLII